MLFKMAELSFTAGIAKMKGMIDQGITKDLNVVLAILLGFGTKLALLRTGRSAADMSAITGRRIETIAMSWNEYGRMFF